MLQNIVTRRNPSIQFTIFAERLNQKISTHITLATTPKFNYPAHNKTPKNERPRTKLAISLQTPLPPHNRHIRSSPNPITHTPKRQKKAITAALEEGDGTETNGNVHPGPLIPSFRLPGANTLLCRLPLCPATRALHWTKTDALARPSV